MKLSRRAALRGAGGTLLGLPLLDAMVGRAHGQVTGAPKRFVLVYCGIGPCGEGRNQATGMPDEQVLPLLPGPLTAPLRVGLAPLEAMGLKNDTTVISGLRIPRTGPGRRFGSSGFHYETMGPIVSGVGETHGMYSRSAWGPSADWLLAQRIGSQTRLPSLVYRVQAAEYTNGYAVDNISWRPRTNRNPQYDPLTIRNDPTISPRTAFDQLFTGYTPPGMGPPPAPDPELLRRKEVLARVQASYDRLKPKLGAHDRTKLDEHIANVAELEGRVDQYLVPPPPQPMTCMVPARPPADPMAMAGYGDEDTRASQLIDMIHMAFACDLTRTVSFEITSSMSGIRLPNSLGITYRSWDNSPLPVPPLHEATHGQGNHLSVAEAIAWHIKQVGRLAQKLKSTPDVTGTLLDHTAIIFVMEAGLGKARDPNEFPPHTSEGMAAVVVGGSSMGMQLGRHIVSAGEHPAQVLLTGMRAVTNNAVMSLGDLSGEIAGLRA
ncbi:MAG: DUF1552 domain-containing protein [Myxococcaceae bacterium]|nr:DUF1552 domain-containing protein [Myxococcaceae bacterium]